MSDHTDGFDIPGSSYLLQQSYRVRGLRDPVMALDLV